MSEQLASNLAQTIETHPGLRELRLFGHTIALALAQDVIFSSRNLETLVRGLGRRGLPHEWDAIELAKARELTKATSDTLIKNLDIRYMSVYSDVCCASARAWSAFV